MANHYKTELDELIRRNMQTDSGLNDLIARNTKNKDGQTLYQRELIDKTRFSARSTGFSLFYTYFRHGERTGLGTYDRKGLVNLLTNGRELIRVKRYLPHSINNATEEISKSAEIPEHDGTEVVDHEYYVQAFADDPGIRMRTRQLIEYLQNNRMLHEIILVVKGINDGTEEGLKND